ncbi:DUF1016 N-terminal domain-containing protein [Flavobacterium sp. 1]|uniref:DUF1016 N-terminal domain-containing protein n=1 Tax=Flavobacterium sp. 1 TaxID=2035200 RepID=UPI0012FE1B36
MIPKVAIDLRNELSEVKGFSERNIRAMVSFYIEYSNFSIWQLPVAELETDSIG